MIEVHPEADAELQAAIGWYTQRSVSLGLRLTLAVDDAFARVEALPESHVEVPATGAPVPVRRALVHDFPYAVMFMQLDRDIHVVAIAHAKRDPGYWLGRLTR